MAELVCFSLHAYLKFTQGIKVFQDTEQHHDKMRIAVKTLHISLASLRFTTDLKNIIFINLKFNIELQVEKRGRDPSPVLKLPV